MSNILKKLLIKIFLINTELPSSDKGVYKQIVKSFEDKITDIKYTVSYDVNGAVNISTETTTIYFFNNEFYNSVECSIYNNKNNHPYSLREALIGCGLKIEAEELFYEYSNVPVSEYIKQYINIIGDKLKHILLGDFKWTEEIDTLNENIRLIEEKLKTSLIGEHPIYLKMIAGDESWKDDLENL